MHKKWLVNEYLDALDFKIVTFKVLINAEFLRFYYSNNSLHAIVLSQVEKVAWN